MIGVTHVDRERTHGRVSQKLGPEHRHEVLRLFRRADFQWIEAQPFDDGIRPVQRKPPFAGFEPAAQRLRLGIVRYDVAGVGEQHIDFVEHRDGRIVFGNPDTNVLVFVQQLQQLETCEIEIVILAAADQQNIDSRFRHIAFLPNSVQVDV